MTVDLTTIDLLADTKHELLKAAGVGQSEWKGNLYWDRTTFVVDPSGAPIAAAQVQE